LTTVRTQDAQTTESIFESSRCYFMFVQFRSTVLPQFTKL